jgi:hypothetical protein
MFVPHEQFLFPSECFVFSRDFREWCLCHFGNIIRSMTQMAKIKASLACGLTQLHFWYYPRCSSFPGYHFRVTSSPRRKTPGYSEVPPGVDFVTPLFADGGVSWPWTWMRPVSPFQKSSVLSWSHTWEYPQCLERISAGLFDPGMW